MIHQHQEHLISTKSMHLSIDPSADVIQIRQILPLYHATLQILTFLVSFSRTFTRSLNVSAYSSSPSTFSFFLLPDRSADTMTTLVGLLVLPAAPSSALDVTKMYGMLCSSQRTGICEITSGGEISAARITMAGMVALGRVAGDFRSALTTSFTPRLRVLFFAAVFQRQISH